MANGISLNDPNEGTTDVRIYRSNDNIILKTGDASTGDVLPNGDNNINLGSGSARWGHVYGVATSARYADLAEKYTIKEKVEVGDVVIISDLDVVEAELSKGIASSKVLGVISEKPAYMMNADLENGKYVALRGRVPCKVQGKVKKGDNLVTYFDGTAISIDNVYKECETHKHIIFAKALENSDIEETKLIEVVIL